LDGFSVLHGSYHDPDEVVLDWLGLLRSETFEQKFRMSIRPSWVQLAILFVGCGSRLEKIRTSVLLKWASEAKEYSQQALFTDSEWRYLGLQTLVRLKYGGWYGDLVPCLMDNWNASQSIDVSVYASSRESCRLFEVFLGWT